MEYFSSRDNGLPVSFCQAVLSGFAPDGGVYVPDHLPRRFSDGDLATLAWLSHGRRIAHIMSMFIKDIDFNTLVSFAEEKYTKERFGTNTTPIRRVGDRCYLELWHGPSGSVEDLAAEMLWSILFETRKTLERRETFLFIADNEIGAAISNCTQNVPEAKFIVRGLSKGNDPVPFEREQGLFLRADGNSGEIAEAFNSLFREKDILETIAASELIPVRTDSSNLIVFFSRVVIYLSAYCEMVLRRHVKFPHTINLCLYADDIEHLAAAWFAKHMGVPINRIICAVPEDGILANIYASGKITGSNLPAALERMLFEMSGRDTEFISHMTKALERDGAYTLPTEIMERLKEDLRVYPLDQAQAEAAVHASWEEDKYPLSLEAAACRVAADRYAGEMGEDIPVLLASGRDPQSPLLENRNGTGPMPLKEWRGEILRFFKSLRS